MPIIGDHLTWRNARSEVHVVCSLAFTFDTATTPGIKKSTFLRQKWSLSCKSGQLGYSAQNDPSREKINQLEGESGKEGASRDPGLEYHSRKS